MADTDPTALEAEILKQYHDLYGSYGFPQPSAVRVVKREHTGVGRFSDLQSDASVRLGDGMLTPPPNAFVAMEGIPSGMTITAYVKDGRVTLLELCTYGDESWDGVERPWRIADGSKE